jgi:hypothetical protein
MGNEELQNRESNDSLRTGSIEGKSSSQCRTHIEQTDFHACMTISKQLKESNNYDNDEHMSKISTTMPRHMPIYNFEATKSLKD